MTDAVPTDATLLAASRGDDSAFADLVLRHVRAATMFATQLLGDYDDAEDVVQQAFVVVYERRNDYDSTRPFGPWLYGIVRRLATKRRARIALRRRLLQRWGPSPTETADRHLVEHALGARIDNERLAGRAREAMLGLSEMQRNCFELVAVRGVSGEEVAAMHGISESTVRQHVFRARRALQSALTVSPDNGARDDHSD